VKKKSEGASESSRRAFYMQNAAVNRRARPFDLESGADARSVQHLVGRRLRLNHSALLDQATNFLQHRFGDFKRASPVIEDAATPAVLPAYHEDACAYPLLQMRR